MANSNSNSNNGVGLGSIIFVVFLILKLCGTIDWSWWWVTAPLWIPFGFWISVLVLCFLIAPKSAKQGLKQGLKEALGTKKPKDVPRTMNFAELCNELNIDKSVIDEKCGE